jgi:hypothetical protein
MVDRVSFRATLLNPRLGVDFVEEPEPFLSALVADILHGPNSTHYLMQLPLSLRAPFDHAVKDSCPHAITMTHSTGAQDHYNRMVVYYTFKFLSPPLG